MNNSIFVIHPYLYRGIWVFDDERVGLVHEALVEGVPEIIERLTAEKGIDTPNLGFTLYFAKSPFPNCDLQATWIREETGGNWYGVAPDQWKKPIDNDKVMEGWLCPALFHYFEEAPPTLYIKAEARKGEANPQAINNDFDVLLVDSLMRDFQLAAMGRMPVEPPAI